MQEELKKVTSETTGSADRTVTLFIQSRLIVLNGEWSWDMHSHTVYCSEVMAFPQNFEGTKGVFHPDDVTRVRNAVELLWSNTSRHLDFRIITTYGEVKKITGQGVFVLEMSQQDLEPAQNEQARGSAIQQIIFKKELEFLTLRKNINELAERLHSIGPWFINKSTGEVWYSDQVFRIYGLPLQSLNAHAHTFNSFIHPDDRVPVIEAFENAYQQELPLHLQYRIILPGGDIRRVQQSTQWMYNKKGQIILTGMLRDLTEETLVEERITSAENNISFYKQVLRFTEQGTNTGYWHMNLITRKTVYSDNCLRIYGLKQPYMPNNNSLLNLVHPDDREQAQAVMEKMYREHVLEETEFRIIRPDGKQRHLKQSGKLLVHRGADQIMLGMVQDITIQKAREYKLQEISNSISLQKIITEHTEEFVDISYCLWHPNGQVEWSDGFYRLLGYRPGGVEAMQRLFEKAVYPQDLKMFKDTMTLVAENQQPEELRVRIISKAGVRYIRISFRQIAYNNKTAALGMIQDITSQVDLQQKAQSDRNFAKMIGDAVEDIVMVINGEYNIISWNAAAEERLKIKKEEALYHNFFDVFPQLNEERYLHQLQAILLGGDKQLHKAQTGYLNKPHTYYLAPFKNERGEVVGILHIVKDISNELQLQQRLNERLNFIENLIEASVDRIVVLDSSMNYLYWNKKAEEYYAINKDRVLGKNILEIFPGLRNDPSYQQFRRVLKGETIHITASVEEDETEYSETYLIPVKDENEEVTAVLWIVHDLSKEYLLQQERNKANEQIKEQAYYLKRITDTVPAMISVMELRTRAVIFLNGQTFAQNGFDPDEMTSKKTEELNELIHPEDRQQLASYFQAFATATDDDIIIAEYRSKNNTGKWYWFSVRGRVFQRDNTGKATHILNIIENITDRKNSDQELLRIKDELANQATEKYLSLFNSIDQGFCIIKILFDENKKATDYRFLEVNPAYEMQTGLHNAVGKSIRELVPGHAEHWFRIFGKVALTGVSAHFEEKIGATESW